MTTLKAALRRVAQLPGFGVDIVRVFPIASLTTTTVVVTELKRGEPASRYANWYIVRRDAASSADRVRQVSAFDGSTGTLTHAGTNFADTTATSEYVELWVFDPEQLDQFAQRVLNVCRRQHRDLIPSHGGAEYYLDQYAWIEHAGQIQRLLWAGDPNMARNSQFDDWNVVSSAGALQPDKWTLGGSAATFARASTNPYRGQYELAITRAGTNATCTQYLGAAANAGGRSLMGDAVDDLLGETVSILAIGRGTALVAYMEDGVNSPSGQLTTSLNGTHVSGTASMTVATTASRIEFGVYLSEDTTSYVSEIIFVKGEITDAVRRGIHESREVAFDWRDRPPALVPNYRAGRGQGSYYLDSWRPYPLLDNTRLLAGNADADESDIPLDLWAYGIASLLLEAHQVTEPLKYSGLMMEYRDQFTRLRGAHMWDVRSHRLTRKPLGPMLRRV